MCREARVQNAAEAAVRRLRDAVYGSIRPLSSGRKWKCCETDRIAVLVPCYGKSRYVIDAVSSCVFQTKMPDEIIVLLMDEDSVRIKNEIEALSDSVKCICRERMDASSARMHLATLTSAEWIVFLDADDMLDTGFIEETSRHECAVCYPQIALLSGDAADDFCFRSELPSGHPAKALCQNLTSFMRREAFLDMGLDRELSLGGEDLDFLLRLLDGKKYLAVHTERTRYFWRQNVDSQLTGNPLFFISTLRMMKKNASFLADELEAVAENDERNLALWLLRNWSDDNILKYPSLSAPPCNVERKRPLQKVTFIIDKRCNLSCPYCSEKQLRKPEFLSDDEIFKRFDDALSRAEELTGGRLVPQIMGGEPTVWSAGLAERIIGRLRGYRQVVVFTNGTDRGSPFFRQPNFAFITHIAEWKGKSISDFNVLPNELLNICVLHSELEEVGEFMSGIPRGYGSIYFQPCVSDNDEFNMTSDDIARLSEMQKRNGIDSAMLKFADMISIYGEEAVKKMCAECRGVWNIDCTERLASPCCNMRNAVPIVEFTPFSVKDCTGCLNFGNMVV